MANSKTILRGSSNYKPWQRTTLSINPAPSAMSKPVANQNSYDARFPWLNETSYRKMESEVNKMGLSWTEREDAMNDWYRNNVTYLLNDQTLQERDTYLNEQAYQAANLQDPQAYAQYRMEDAVQKAKKLWNLDATANDLDVFADIVGSLPNGNQLAWEYLNGDNKDLLYEAWILERIEAPESPDPTVWGMQSIINKQSEIPADSALGKVNAALDWANLPWKVTQWVDGAVQKIPTLTYEKQVENLSNKMNNLSDEEIYNLYDRYVNMIQNGTDEKWNDDDRWIMELIWDGVIWGDQAALDRVNTLQLYDYSDVVNQDNIQNNKRWNQLLEKLGAWEMNEDMDAAYNRVENLDTNNVVKWLAKASIWGADKTKNLLNFAGWVYGTLQNYAEALGAWLQHLDDIRDKRYASTEWLENNGDAFEAFVANKVANFGEYMTDAPDTLLGKPADPNVIKFVSNIPWSFLKTVSAQVRWKTNQLDSKIWLLNLLFTEEWQQAIFDRYGTTEAFANAINTDPVGTADDLIDLADKFGWVVNAASWGGERERIGSFMDAVSDWIVNGKWTVEINWKNYNVYGINQWLTRVSDWLWDNWYKRTANLVNLERDISTDTWKIRQDAEEIAYQWAEDLWRLTRNVRDASYDAAYKAWESVWEAKNKWWEVSDTWKEKSNEVWESVKDAPTRKIPEKLVENELKLTPKERANVEKNWITAANFVLKENIADLSNENKIIALQDISSDAYNKVTDTFKNVIPADYREKSATASKMLDTMINTMESSDIVKNEYADYIAKLKEMKDYSDYSPYEKLAIRRDFDAIVWNDIFGANWRVKWLEDQTIAKWRADLNDEINEIGKKYGVDVKDENARISNAITIRDGLIRSVSQGKKNNRIWLQDLWIGAIMSAWDPVTAWGIFLTKKVLENNSWKISQSLYNMNKSPLKTANTKKWPWFINKSNGDAQSRFMITTS